MNKDEIRLMDWKKALVILALNDFEEDRPGGGGARTDQVRDYCAADFDLPVFGELIAALRYSGMVNDASPGCYRLTDAGRQAAAALIESISEEG